MSVINPDPRVVQPFAEPYAMDEPIRVTVQRDMFKVFDKFVYVCTPSLWPTDSQRLKQWDLWGPLFLCVILSVGSWIRAAETERRSIFAFIFGFYWLGLYTIVLNINSLGGYISSLQGMGIFGYTSFPLISACLLCLCLPPIFGVLKPVVAACGAYLSTRASSKYIEASVPSERYYLCTYPLIFFHAVIGITVCLI